MEYNIFTVSEITEYLKFMLSSDRIVSDLWLTGEISNFYHHDSGHMYFTIKDETARIKAIMFKSNSASLKFVPENGLKVTAHGYINVYAPRGDYQFYIDKLEPEGKGSLYLAFEQLKEKLEKEGLFTADKKPIPILPGKIGIITSPTGAAIRDILSVVRRRFGSLSILIVPSLVQGDQAADQIVRGIEFLNQRDDIDLIIVSRGGGSIEELWPFNEEIVARAIYHSGIPVITGVGHETDFTIADFVADLRAPTPSAAAELAIANRLELENNLANLRSRLLTSLQTRVDNYRTQVSSLAEKRVFTKPEGLFSQHAQQLDELSRQLEWKMEKRINQSMEQFNILREKLDSFSPLKTLERGYTLTSKKSGEEINRVEEVAVGEVIVTRLVDGIISSKIIDIKGVDEQDG